MITRSKAVVTLRRRRPAFRVMAWPFCCGERASRCPAVLHSSSHHPRLPETTSRSRQCVSMSSRLRDAIIIPNAGSIMVVENVFHLRNRLKDEGYRCFDGGVGDVPPCSWITSTTLFEGVEEAAAHNGVLIGFHIQTKTTQQPKNKHHSPTENGVPQPSPNGVYLCISACVLSFCFYMNEQKGRT